METVVPDAPPAAVPVPDAEEVFAARADFGFADHIRLSYAISLEQIEKGLKRIEEFLKALK